MEINQKKCQVLGHKNQTWFGICLGLKCEKNKRFGCMKCMKLNHKDCSIKEIIDLNDLFQEEFYFFPKWIQQIEDFCEQEVVTLILEERIQNDVDQQFDEFKEKIIEQITQAQQKIKKQFKEKSTLYNETRFIIEEYKKFNLNDKIQNIFQDPNESEQNLQEQVQKFAELFQQSNDLKKLDPKEEEFSKTFQKFQIEIKNIIEFKNDSQKKLNIILSHLSNKMQLINYQQVLENVGLNCLEKKDQILIQDQLKNHFKEFFYFKKIFDTEEDGFDVDTFHNKCDLQPNLLIIFESKENDRFGGFTSLKFDKSRANSTQDGGFNFLFNLNTQKIYTQNNMNKSIQSISNKGPIFGQNDIWIYDQANTRNDSNSSLGEAYGQNEGAQERDLTKKKNFMLQRYQVFKMEFG